MSTVTNGPSRPQLVVLAAIDLSAASGEVLAAAANLGRTQPIELHVVHVVPIPPVEDIGYSHADRQLHLANLADRARRQMSERVKELSPPVGHAALHVRAGIPDVGIAQLASDIGADLLVVGTNGRTGLERILLGSVAESLVRHAPCPVLTYRPKVVPIWHQIAAPCPDCLATQRETARARFFCERHSQHHPRAHTYSEIPPSFGMGSQTFR